MAMTTRRQHQLPHVSATADIDASSGDVYRLLADYRDAHPRILPPAFFRGLRVVKGGFGDGTLITVDLMLFGRTRREWALVTEPEPGRTLVETYPEIGVVTTFTIVSLGSDRSRLTIDSTLPRRTGPLGWLTLWLVRHVLRRAYAAELALVGRHLRGSRPTARMPDPATFGAGRPSVVTPRGARAKASSRVRLR